MLPKCNDPPSDTNRSPADYPAKPSFAENLFRRSALRGRHDPSRHAHEHLARLSIVQHHGSSADGVVSANSNLRYDDSSGSNQCPVAHLDIPGQPGSRGDMNTAAQSAVMIDAGPGVQNSTDPDLSVRLNHSSGHHHCSELENRGRRNTSGGVNQHGDRESARQCLSQAPFSRCVVPDRHKYRALWLTSPLGRGAGGECLRPTHQRPVKRLPLLRRIFIKKRDNLPARCPRDISHDFGVATSSPDQQATGK